MNKEKEMKENVVKEVMDICKDLGLAVETNKPNHDNKFLSAWAKGFTQ